MFVCTSILTGCQRVPIIETKEVYMPIRCEIEYPAKPKYSGVLDKDLSELGKYLKKLENALMFCIKGEY